LKLGVLIECEEGLTWDRWRRISACVEELGFESLWLSDHFMSSHDSQLDSLETWTALTVTAGETSRVRFGPLVCPMTFRHPSLVARIAAAVDVLSGGRLVVGLGAGWNECEHRAFGLPFPPLKKRMEMLEEGIQVVRRLWMDESAAFAGRYYQLEGANPRPKPAQQPRIPILIGGAGDTTLRTVARFADEWDVPGGLSPAAYRAKSERLDHYCREINRDPTEIRRCLSMAYLVARNQSQLFERANAMKRLIPTVAGLDTSAVPDALRSSGWRVGTAEEIARDLRALEEVGVERVILQHNDQTDFEALELIGREVLPALADHGPSSIVSK
jgi:F420-dependent oxidoreductase-like protein